MAAITQRRIDFDNDPVVSNKPANLANSAVLRMLEEEEKKQQAAGQNPGWDQRRQSRSRVRDLDRNTVLRINRNCRPKRHFEWPPRNGRRNRSADDAVHFSESIRKRQDIDQMRNVYDNGHPVETVQRERDLSLDSYLQKTQPKVMAAESTTSLESECECVSQDLINLRKRGEIVQLIRMRNEDFPGHSPATTYSSATFLVPQLLIGRESNSIFNSQSINHDFTHSHDHLPHFNSVGSFSDPVASTLCDGGELLPENVILNATSLNGMSRSRSLNELPPIKPRKLAGLIEKDRLPMDQQQTQRLPITSDKSTSRVAGDLLYNRQNEEARPMHNLTEPKASGLGRDKSEITRAKFDLQTHTEARFRADDRQSVKEPSPASTIGMCWADKNNPENSNVTGTRTDTDSRDIEKRFRAELDQLERGLGIHEAHGIGALLCNNDGIRTYAGVELDHNQKCQVHWWDKNGWKEHVCPHNGKCQPPSAESSNGPTQKAASILISTTGSRATVEESGRRIDGIRCDQCSATEADKQFYGYRYETGRTKAKNCENLYEYQSEKLPDEEDDGDKNKCSKINCKDIYTRLFRNDDHHGTPTALATAPQRRPILKCSDGIPLPPRNLKRQKLLQTPPSSQLPQSSQIGYPFVINSDSPKAVEIDLPKRDLQTSPNVFEITPSRHHSSTLSSTSTTLTTPTTTTTSLNHQNSQNGCSNLENHVLFLDATDIINEEKLMTRLNGNRGLSGSRGGGDDDVVNGARRDAKDISDDNKFDEINKYVKLSQKTTTGQKDGDEKEVEMQAGAGPKSGTGKTNELIELELAIGELIDFADIVKRRPEIMNPLYVPVIESCLHDLALLVLAQNTQISKLNKLSDRPDEDDDDEAGAVKDEPRIFEIASEQDAREYLKMATHDSSAMDVEMERSLIENHPQTHVGRGLPKVPITPGNSQTGLMIPPAPPARRHNPKFPANAESMNMYGGADSGAATDCGMVNLNNTDVSVNHHSHGVLTDRAQITRDATPAQSYVSPPSRLVQLPNVNKSLGYNDDRWESLNHYSCSQNCGDDNSLDKTRGFKRVAWPPPSETLVPASHPESQSPQQQQPHYQQQPQYPATQDQNRAMSQPPVVQQQQYYQPMQQQQQPPQQQQYQRQHSYGQGVPVYQRSFEKGNQSPQVTNIPISLEPQMNGGSTPSYVNRANSPARPTLNQYGQYQQQFRPQQSTLAPKPAIGLRGKSPTTVSFSGGIAVNKPIQKSQNDYYMTQQQPNSNYYNNDTNSNSYQQQQQQQQQQQHRAVSQPAPVYSRSASIQEAPQYNNSQSSIPVSQYPVTQRPVETLSPSVGSPGYYQAHQPTSTSPRGWSHVRASTPTNLPYYQQPLYPQQNNSFNQSYEVTPSQTSSIVYPQSPSYNQPQSPGYAPQYKPASNIQQQNSGADYGQSMPQYYQNRPQAATAPHAQQQFNTYRQPSPGCVTLRSEAPVSQKPAPVYMSQPPVTSFRGGVNMRGDQKWPPEEYKVAAAIENQERLKLAAGPACRPRRVNKDYSYFFAQHALNSTYPGYKVPPGTQHYAQEM